MSRPGIRGDLRPDLRGVELHLTHADTPRLHPGETGTLRVIRVLDHGHPECVLVCGHWTGPDGATTVDGVLVQLGSLPRAAAIPAAGGS